MEIVALLLKSELLLVLGNKYDTPVTQSPEDVGRKPWRKPPSKKSLLLLLMLSDPRSRRGLDDRGDGTGSACGCSCGGRRVPRTPPVRGTGLLPDLRRWALYTKSTTVGASLSKALESRRIVPRCADSRRTFGRSAAAAASRSRASRRCVAAIILTILTRLHDDEQEKSMKRVLSEAQIITRITNLADCLRSETGVVIPNNNVSSLNLHQT